MNNKEDGTELDKLKAISRKIEEAEKAVMELKSLGKGVPVIEKNARSILSIMHALRFGISDLAETEEFEGGSSAGKVERTS